MTPIKLNGANKVYTAPRGWDVERSGPCEALEVIDTGEFLQSAWLPDAEELAALNAGQPVTLMIWGKEHPVVAVGVIAPETPQRETTDQ